jgi:hypothetical protein
MSLEPALPDAEGCRAEEELIPDARAGRRPAEMVQERLITLLKLAALPVSHSGPEPTPGRLS